LFYYSKKAKKKAKPLENKPAEIKTEETKQEKTKTADNEKEGEENNISYV
jgi:hypothetical protein